MKSVWIVLLVISFMVEKSMSSTSTELPANPESTSTGAELTSTNPELTSTNPELTSTNPELTSTNPELTSTNAELTSTNQELTSTNPELTSTNPELTSTNPELTSTNLELTSTNSELTSTDPELTSTDTESTSTDLELTSTESDTDSGSASTVTHSTSEVTMTQSMTTGETNVTSNTASSAGMETNTDNNGRDDVATTTNPMENPITSNDTQDSTMTMVLENSTEPIDSTTKYQDKTTQEMMQSTRTITTTTTAPLPEYAVPPNYDGLTMSLELSIRVNGSGTERDGFIFRLQAELAYIYSNGNAVFLRVDVRDRNTRKRRQVGLETIYYSVVNTAESLNSEAELSEYEAFVRDIALDEVKDIDLMDVDIDQDYIDNEVKDGQLRGEVERLRYKIIDPCASFMTLCNFSYTCSQSENGAYCYPICFTRDDEHCCNDGTGVTCTSSQHEVCYVTGPNYGDFVCMCQDGYIYFANSCAKESLVIGLSCAIVGAVVLALLLIIAAMYFKTKKSSTYSNSSFATIPESGDYETTRYYQKNGPSDYSNLQYENPSLSKSSQL